MSQDAARDDRSFSVGSVHLVAELAEALQVLFSKLSPIEPYPKNQTR